MHSLACRIITWVVFCLLTSQLLDGSTSSDEITSNNIMESRNTNAITCFQTLSKTLVYVYNDQHQERLASQVEMAFDTYRRELTKYMGQIDEVVTAMTNLDEISGDDHSAAPSPLKKIHDKFRNDIKTVPALWEHNELVLRLLLQPRSVCLTSAILNTTGGQIDFGQWNWVFTHKKKAVTNTTTKLAEGKEPPKANTTTRENTDNISTNTTIITELKAAREVSSYDSLKHILVHLARDWGDHGAETRRLLYSDGILPLARKHIQSIVESSGRTEAGASESVLVAESSPKVLVPGAGLGRLAVELSVAGFRVDANECSSTMILCTAALLDRVLSLNNSTCDTLSNSNSSSGDKFDNTRDISNTDPPYAVYPHISGGMYDLWSLSERLRSEHFPSSDALHIIDDLATHGDPSDPYKSSESQIRRNLALHLGEFQQIFTQRHHANQYDGVVTCFFLDTADHILEYVLIIKHVLRHGGVWINAGPLHYHRAFAIPYSHEQIVALVADLGFAVVEAIEVATIYATEKYINMKPDYYHVPVTVFRLTKLSTEDEEENKKEKNDATESTTGASVSNIDAATGDVEPNSVNQEKARSWRGVDFVLN